MGLWCIGSTLTSPSPLGSRTDTFIHGIIESDAIAQRYFSRHHMAG